MKDMDDLTDQFFENTSSIQQGDNDIVAYIYDARDLLRIIIAQRNVWRKRWEKLIINNALEGETNE
jgi:hypothetical protein